MEFKGSRTEANLMAAFSGEAMAESRYNFYAQAARSEGLLPAAEIFEETARNEAAHAKLWFGALGKLGGTLDNLKDAQAGERFEWTDIYARFDKRRADENIYLMFNKLTPYLRKLFLAELTVRNADPCIGQRCGYL